MVLHVVSPRSQLDGSIEVKSERLKLRPVHLNTHTQVTHKGLYVERISYPSYQQLFCSSQTPVDFPAVKRQPKEQSWSPPIQHLKPASAVGAQMMARERYKTRDNFRASDIIACSSFA